MAKQGRAGPALAIAVIESFIAGLRQPLLIATLGAARSICAGSCPNKGIEQDLRKPEKTRSLANIAGDHHGGA